MMTRDQYVTKLQSKGCDIIGRGLYSRVLSIPYVSDKVIKVGEHDAWPEYIKWATERGHAGKLAPKVYSLKFHENFYVAIMERLVCTIGDIRDFPYSYPRKVYMSCHNDDCEASELANYIRLLRQNQLSGDLHDENVMLRSDGQIVVTDPVAKDCPYSQFRIRNGACL